MATSDRAIGLQMGLSKHSFSETTKAVSTNPLNDHCPAVDDLRDAVKET